jgi:hypothetical protein
MIGGYDLLGISTDLTLEKEAIVEETTALGMTAEEWAPVGLTRLAVSQNGFYDDVVDAAHQAVLGADNRILNVGLAGNAVGRLLMGISGVIQTKYTRQGARGALTKAAAEYVGDGAVEEGIVSHQDGTETTATGDSTAHDNGAQTTNGGAGYLQVVALALGGYTSVTIKFRDSADNVSYADISGGAFTNVTAAPNAQRITISGTIRRYTQTRWIFNGTGSGMSIRFLTGLVRN